jgi:D-alanyl-D-alanine carboxypeptidase (penicillin-binding protein 5/6)
MHSLFLQTRRARHAAHDNQASTMKKLLAAIAAVALSVSVAFAQSVPAPVIAAKSWVLLDATSNQILASDNPDMRIEPASLTKLMTAYVVFDALRDKRLDMNQMVTVSTKAWKVDAESSKMFIEPRVPVSVHDLIYGLVVQSGNDAAVALAEATAGTEEAFVSLMNKEAERMGMKSTHFANAHGLPDPNNYSTARDLAILAARSATDHPEYFKIYSVKDFTYNKIKQPNRNRLLWLDPSVDGLKTGHTQEAGFCLVASALRQSGANQRRLISVLLGANSDQARTQESLKLLNWGYQNFDVVKLYAKNQPVATPDVWKGSQNTVKVGFMNDVYITVPKGAAGNMKPPVLERKDPLVAPIDKGSQVGMLKVQANDGKVLATLPVVALEQVDQAGMFGRAVDAVRLWLH